MKPGDTMIRAHYHGTAERVTVKAIGRKWATASDGRRYDLATLTDEGGGYTLRTPERLAAQCERHCATDAHRTSAPAHCRAGGVTMSRVYIAIPVDPARAEIGLGYARETYDEHMAERNGYTGPPCIARLVTPETSKKARHALAEALLGIEATTVEEYRSRAHALAMNWKLEE